jgi:hypothetical protein
MNTHNGWIISLEWQKVTYTKRQEADEPSVLDQTKNIITSVQKEACYTNSSMNEGGGGIGLKNSQV